MTKKTVYAYRLPKIIDRCDIEIQMPNGNWINLQDFHDSAKQQYPDWVNAIMDLVKYRE